MSNDLETFEDYGVPEERAVYIDPKSQEIKDYDSLSPWEKIKEASKKFGVEITEPNKKCKKCFGRGYTGMALDGSHKIPIACKCIYLKKGVMNVK